MKKGVYGLFKLLNISYKKRMEQEENILGKEKIGKINQKILNSLYNIYVGKLAI